jgi:uncharacterized protein (TIGR02145 family)
MLKFTLLFSSLSFLLINCVFSQNKIVIDPKNQEEYQATVINDNLLIMNENYSYKPKDGDFLTKMIDGKETLYYDWETAKNMAPEGWRLPTREEFELYIKENGREGLYKRSKEGTVPFTIDADYGMIIQDSWQTDGAYFWCNSHDDKHAFSFALKKPVDGSVYTSTGAMLKTIYVTVRYVKEFDVFEDERDGKKYGVISVGDHKIMIDNFSHNVDEGMVIPNEGKADPEQVGFQYTWEKARESAPAGWHLPSKEEWEDVLQLTKLNENPFYIVKKSYPLRFEMAGWTNAYELSPSFDYNVLFWTSTLHKKDKYYYTQISKSNPSSVNGKKKANSYLSVVYFKDK